MAEPTTPPAGPPAKKGLSPLVWVGIGCAVILLVGLVAITAGGLFVAKKVKEVAGDFEENPAKAAALLAVRMNPEVELVESDDDAGTLSIRNKRTGEILTFHYDEIQKGRLSFTGKDGQKVTMGVQGQGDQAAVVVTGPKGEQARFGAGGSLPSWIPAPPGAAGVESTAQFSQGGESSGAGQAFSSRSVEDVAAYYERQMEGLGLTVQKTEVTGGQGRTVFLNGQSAHRHLAVTITRADDGQTAVTLTYRDGV